MAKPRPTPMLLAACGLLLAGLACNALNELPLGAEPTATPPPSRTPASDPTEAPTDEPTRRPEPRPSRTPRPTRTPRATEAPTEPAGGGVLFSDSFDDNANGWDVDSGETAGREFRNGVYAIQVFNTVWFAWANPATEDFTDIHIKVTVSNAAGQDPAFGVLCSYLNADAFYFLGFGDDGYYGIARIEGDDFILLTSDENSWTQSEAIELFQSSYTLEADCHADGRLRLVVDGVEIAAVQDDAPYGAGGIGLFVQSFDNVPVEVEFDDLEVTRLEE